MNLRVTFSGKVKHLEMCSRSESESEQGVESEGVDALFRLAFASAADLKSLTSPEKVTRRFIMQKARRHTRRCSDRL